MTIILLKRDYRLSFKSFRYYSLLINDFKGIKTYRNHMEEIKSRDYIMELRIKNLIVIRV